MKGAHVNGLVYRYREKLTHQASTTYKVLLLPHAMYVLLNVFSRNVKFDGGLLALG